MARHVQQSFAAALLLVTDAMALITEALANTHLTTLNNGIGGVSACRRDHRTKRGTRDVAEVALVKKMASRSMN